MTQYSLSEVHVAEALELADSFSEACANGKEIPTWALALRSLAGAYRRARTDPQVREELIDLADQAQKETIGMFENAAKFVDAAMAEQQEDYDFAPGSHGFHEFVDRACLIAELFSRELREHPVAKHPKLKKRVKKLESKLYQLYNDAAIIHMCEEQGDGSL